MEHSCEVWLKFAQWFRRRCHLSKKLTTDDGRRVIKIAHLELCSGQQKTHCVDLCELLPLYFRLWLDIDFSNTVDHLFNRDFADYIKGTISTDLLTKLKT